MLADQGNKAASKLMTWGGGVHNLKQHCGCHPEWYVWIGWVGRCTRKCIITTDLRIYAYSRVMMVAAAIRKSTGIRSPA